MCFPADCLNAALNKSDELFRIYPLLLYPCRLVDRGGMVRVSPSTTGVNGERGTKATMNLNLGALRILSIFIAFQDIIMGF